MICRQLVGGIGGGQEKGTLERMIKEDSFKKWYLN